MPENDRGLRSGACYFVTQRRAVYQPYCKLHEHTANPHTRNLVRVMVGGGILADVFGFQTGLGAVHIILWFHVAGFAFVFAQVRGQEGWVRRSHRESMSSIAQ